MKKVLGRVGCGVFVVFTLALVSGCATTAGQDILAKSGIGVDSVKALQDLKTQIQPVLGVVAQDAAATRAWSGKVLGLNGTNPDPLKYRLATACPDATDAIGGTINQTIDGLISQIQTMQAGPDPNAPQGRLMLFLTQLKYGPQGDPQAQVNALKANLALQMDALFTGCAHLFPKKQINDLLILLSKAGIVGSSGGVAAPFISVITNLP